MVLLQKKDDSKALDDCKWLLRQSYGKRDRSITGLRDQSNAGKVLSLYRSTQIDARLLMTEKSQKTQMDALWTAWPPQHNFIQLPRAPLLPWGCRSRPQSSQDWAGVADRTNAPIALAFASKVAHLGFYTNHLPSV